MWNATVLSSYIYSTSPVLSYHYLSGLLQSVLTEAWVTIPSGPQIASPLISQGYNDNYCTLLIEDPTRYQK